jgi:hypothetical protein
MIIVVWFMEGGGGGEEEEGNQKGMRIIGRMLCRIDF